MCLWCACGVACLLLSGGLSMRCLLFLDSHTGRGDIIRLHSSGSWLLLPFVRACLKFSPRGHSENSVENTLCQQHLRPSQKKKHRDKEGSLSACDQQFVMNCQEHNRSCKRSTSVLASMRWLLCGEKKRDLTSVPKTDICNRTQTTSSISEGNVFR